MSINACPGLQKWKIMSKLEQMSHMHDIHMVYLFLNKMYLFSNRIHLFLPTMYLLSKHIEQDIRQDHPFL